MCGRIELFAVLQSLWDGANVRLAALCAHRPHTIYPRRFHRHEQTNTIFKSQCLKVGLCVVSPKSGPTESIRYPSSTRKSDPENPNLRPEHYLTARKRPNGKIHFFEFAQMAWNSFFLTFQVRSFTSEMLWHYIISKLPFFHELTQISFLHRHSDHVD